MTLSPKQYSRLKALWFARWLAMNYSDVLNTESGIWYAEKLQHFEKHVYKEWLRSGKNRTHIKPLWSRNH